MTTDINTCYCRSTSPGSHFLSLPCSFGLHNCASAHSQMQTRARSCFSLSLLPSVYKLRQSHPSKPVDHEIRLRRKAVNDTGVGTNENIRMRKYRSKAADTVVVICIQNCISQLPPSFYLAHFPCCVLLVRTVHTHTCWEAVYKDVRSSVIF